MSIMPKAFISSTAEDLKSCRESARDAAIIAGFQPVMLEYFSAQSESLPYKACMKKVADCDVVIAIVAHRYGWVPPDQPGAPRALRGWSVCRLGRPSLDARFWLSLWMRAARGLASIVSHID
jgi:hypothetical protein